MSYHFSTGAIDVIGYLAAGFTTASWLPQVIRTWRTRSAGDLSPTMLAAYTGGSALWLLYGLAQRALPIIVANAATLALSLLLVGLRVRFAGASTPGR